MTSCHEEHLRGHKSFTGETFVLDGRRRTVDQDRQSISWTYSDDGPLEI